MALPAAPAPAIVISDRAEILSDNLERVVQRSQHDDRRAVLVVVEHGDVEQFPQAGLDLEAPWRRNVLEVDPREDRRDAPDDLDDLIGVLGVQTDGESVDVGEPLEQCGLTLHHGQRSQRSQVAEPEHRRAVGDHGNGVPLDGEPTRVLGVLGNRQAHASHAGRVDQRKVVAVADRDLRADLELATEVDEEGPVAHVADRHALDGPQRLGELVGVCAVDVAAQVTSTRIRS